MTSLQRKLALRAQAALVKSTEQSISALARTTQAAHSTVAVGDSDVPLVDTVQDARDAAEALPELEDGTSLAGDDAWEAWDQSDYAVGLSVRLEAELGEAKVALDQALEEAAQALADSDLARSEAAQAVADAADAAAAASQANQDALEASQLAEGAAPSWNTVDPVTADASGKPVGAIWYVRNAAGNVIRMWELTALGWVARPFDETVIPQVAIGSGTYGSLAGDRLVANSITAEQIKALAITAAELAANSVTAVKIAANAVSAAKISAGSVTTDKLYALAVTAEKIAAGAIIADKIAAGAITTAKLAATAIDGMTITGAVVRTAATGQRVQLDTAGLRTFNAANQETSRLAASVGGLLLTGSLTSYPGGNSPRAELTNGVLSFDHVGSAGAGKLDVSVSGIAGKIDSAFLVGNASNEVASHLLLYGKKVLLESNGPAGVFANGSRLDGRMETTINVAASSGGSSGTTYWSTTYVHTFPTPYSKIPIVSVTLAGPGSHVMWANVFNVTTTSFQFRTVAINGAPPACQLHVVTRIDNS